MGEYAIYQGVEIKIGTCEDMYYLRADQRDKVTPLPGSLCPASNDVLGLIRFRFPWPDEDDIEPGSDKFYDKGYARSYGVHGMLPPSDVDHHSIQFSAPVGLLVSLPCPNSEEGKSQPYKVHRNGYQGDVAICGTAWRGGEWRVILKCGACGAMYNAPREHAEEVAAKVRASADFALRDKDEGRAKWLHAVADRMLAGYAPVAV